MQSVGGEGSTALHPRDWDGVRWGDIEVGWGCAVVHAGQHLLVLGGGGNRVGVHFVPHGILLVCWEEVEGCSHWVWLCSFGVGGTSLLQGCGLVASLLCWVEGAVGLL